MLRDWSPEVMFPDPSTSAGLRTLLLTRYQHLSLKFGTPSLSENYEASWNGGSAAACSEEELLDQVLEALQDCGTDRHDWITKSEIRDSNNPDNVLRTQRLVCTYCDPRERVITASSPLPQEEQARERRWPHGVTGT